MRKLFYLLGLVLSLAVIHGVWHAKDVSLVVSADICETEQYVCTDGDDEESEQPFCNYWTDGANLVYQLFELQIRTNVPTCLLQQRHRDFKQMVKAVEMVFGSRLSTQTKAFRRSESSPFAFSSLCHYYVFALRRIVC